MTQALTRGSAAVLLPIVAFLYGAAYYGTRSVLAVRAAQAGVGVVDIGWALSAGSAAALLGILLSGLLGAALGPSGVAALGLAVAGASCLVPSSSATSLIACSALLGFGSGLCRPGLYAAAGRPWPAADGAGIALVLVLAWVGLNGAAAVAPNAIGLLLTSAPDLLGPIGAALFLGAATLATIDAAVQWLAPRADPAPPAAAWDPRALTVAGAVALGLAGLQAAWSLGAHARYAALAPAVQAAPWLDLLDPVTIIALGLPLAVGLGVAAAVGARVPLLLPAGVGFAVLGASCLLAAAGSMLTSSPPLVAALVVLGAAAEVGALPLAFAAAVRGVPWRASTAVVSFPMAAVTAVSLLGQWLPQHPALAVLAGLALLPIGVAVAVAAIPVDRWLLGAEPPAPR